MQICTAINENNISQASVTLKFIFSAEIAPLIDVEVSAKESVTNIVDVTDIYILDYSGSKSGEYVKAELVNNNLPIYITDLTKPDKCKKVSELNRVEGFIQTIKIIDVQNSELTDIPFEKTKNNK